MSFEERRRGGHLVEGCVLQPGEITLVSDGSKLVTVVGFGVVVCLWELTGAAALMCHFLEPAIYDVSKATPRYGNVALPKAIEWIRQYCPKGVFEAQVFGGASAKPKDHRGTKNLDMARKVLKARKIAIVSEDVGGQKGRKIMFDSRTGHVAVIKVHQLRDGDWNL